MDDFSSLSARHRQQFSSDLDALIVSVFSRGLQAVGNRLVVQIAIICSDVQTATAGAFLCGVERANQWRDFWDGRSIGWLVWNRSAHGVKCSLAGLDTGSDFYYARLTQRHDRSRSIARFSRNPSRDHRAEVSFHAAES